MTSLSIRSAKSRWMHGIFPDGQPGERGYIPAGGGGGRSGDGSVYINKYRDLMKYAAGTPPSERFETTHGFYMAVVQGFFRKHYYVRGTAVSFMAEEYPMMERYITPWKDILPEGILPPAQQGIVENYSAGVYLSAEQVKELLSDYEGNKEVREAVDDYFMENGAVLLKALRDAAENEAGMLEATDVVEVEPLDLKKRHPIQT